MKPVKLPKRESERDRGYSNILHHLVKGQEKQAMQHGKIIMMLSGMEEKLDSLIEVAGGGTGEALKNLGLAADLLDTESNKLSQAVEQNQPKTGGQNNG